MSTRRKLKEGEATWITLVAAEELVDDDESQLSADDE
jgi:hypothetical protein